ncbi:MAG: two-component regulator propeller domain-containing protein, partial [Verrucomicrobiota bacterium]
MHHLRGIQADTHGDVWLLNIRGEAQRVRDGLVVKPPPEMAEFPSLVPQLALDDQKRLLMIRNGYVAEILPSGFQRVEFASAELRPYYACVTPSKAGGLWVSGDGRVRRWAQESWQQDLGLYPWGDAFVICMMESSSGHLLVGTLQSGLFIYSPKQGWVNFNRTNGLPQNWIRCLAEDQEHNLWVGNSGGLVIMQPSVGMQSPPDNWEGYPVQAIIRATNGAIWAATEGAGLYRLQDNSWTRYGVESGLSNSYVWSLIQDRRGDIWAGTWGGGLFRLEGDRFVQQFDFEQRGEPVTALCESPDGTLWIGTAVGLIRWASNKLERFAPMKGALAGDVRALAVGQDGRFWIGTQGSGIVCYENGRFRTICQTNGLPSDYILSLFEDSDRTLWIGTLDKGLCRYRDGNYKVISTKDGLPHNAVGHIEDDGLGSLWLNTQRGLVRVSKTNLHAYADGHLATLPAQVFRKGAGLASLAGSSGFTPSGFRAPDGHLWFPTSRGIAVVSPESIRANQVPPAVWIEEIRVDGQPVKLTTTSSKSRQLNGGKAPTREVQLKPGRSQIEVVYT